ncbi:MAG: o-succinylbenzoate--CoA ligase [Pseudonocardia sp.]
MRTIRCDGSPTAVAELTSAIAAALDNAGPPVLPLGAAGAALLPLANVATVTDTTAVVVATSGSGGEPRFVELPTSALRASAAATQARIGDARWLLALPAEHIAGVQVIVRALLAGDAPVVQNVRTGFHVADFAVATARLGAGPCCTSLVPTQLLRLLDAGGPAVEALRSYTAVLVGGAALDAGLRARAEVAGVHVVTTYGMSETAGGCVYDGVPLDGVRIELDGGDGRVRIGGPILATGYLGLPDESAAAFGGDWFRTADLGRWHGDRLEVLGRVDDVIVTGGEKVVPAAVEQALTAQPGVRGACVVGVPDPEWGHVVAAAVVPDAAASPDHDRLRDAVRADLGRAAVPRRMLSLPELPLRGVGKPDRAAVARLFTSASNPAPLSG